MVSRLKNRLLSIASNGISPRKAALTLAIGVTIGVMPIPWGATPLCAVVALILGLNQAGIQAANYLAYPLQIALFVPFCKTGERLIPFTTPKVAVDGKIAQLMVSFCSASGKALLVWLIIAPFAAAALYLLLHPFFRRGLPPPEATQ